ncbi:MAG TPA: arsenic resistance N-acetyltransferase ArsN2 [Minicystis sp.]|nr:arsenic resistance N-acetyltransferase ArsN2 [Minicystis sp.]
MKTVLFACVHNAGRSQMAAAWFDRVADPAIAIAVSAGTEPGQRVHPEVVEAMREAGVDLSAARPARLTDELAHRASLLVTMGCGEACPAVHGLAREDWPLDDPKGRPIEAVRAIRDEIERRVRALARRIGAAPATVRPARPSDAPRVLELLGAAGLPLDGVCEHLDAFRVAEDDARRVIAAGGLEVYGDAALLRSVVVARDARAGGVGRALVRELAGDARSRGARTLFLLTTTARAYFEGLGFETIPRADAPAALAASAELRGACPASAVMMRRPA